MIYVGIAYSLIPGFQQYITKRAVLAIAQNSSFFRYKVKITVNLSIIFEKERLGIVYQVSKYS